jgi:hypothetical protein
MSFGRQDRSIAALGGLGFVCLGILTALCLHWLVRGRHKVNPTANREHNRKKPVPAEIGLLSNRALILVIILVDAVIIYVSTTK